MQHFFKVSYVFRRTIFDANPDDPDYTPLPEERPGGFEWGRNAQENNGEPPAAQ